MRWFWIDRILSLESRKRIVTVKNISLAEEHLHDHLREDGATPPVPVMPASLIIEGMAQSGGILIGDASGFREQVVLAKITRADIYADAPPGACIRHTCEIEQLTPQGASTRGYVDLLYPGDDSIAPTRIADISLVFSHLQSSGVRSELPKHNFVFDGALWGVLGLSVEARAD